MGFWHIGSPGTISVHSYLVIRWWSRSSTSILANSAPRQIHGPAPNGISSVPFSSLSLSKLEITSSLSLPDPSSDYFVLRQGDSPYAAEGDGEVFKKGIFFFPFRQSEEKLRISPLKRYWAGGSVA
ncbi:hypothetical protein CRG98_038993 [Punica granatum]|uniref:Uncharacterized protein n=1 Tax=Punica granatum TaxID=22663 RepID=A0A2I0I9T6_PUNGR|nr:hypothetical protein CRG98_038993 [Punica granatum]